MVEIHTPEFGPVETPEELEKLLPIEASVLSNLLTLPTHNEQSLDGPFESNLVNFSSSTSLNATLDTPLTRNETEGYHDLKAVLSSSEPRFEAPSCSGLSTKSSSGILFSQTKLDHDLSTTLQQNNNGSPATSASTGLSMSPTEIMSVSSLASNKPVIPFFSLDVNQPVPEVPERVIFLGNAQLTSCEVFAIKKLQSVMFSDVPTNDVLLRVIFANQGRMLLDVCNHWNRIKHWEELRAKASKAFQKYCELGLLYCYGSSQWGHPIVICRSRVLSQIPADQRFLLVFHLLSVVRFKLLIPGSIEQFVILVDLDGCEFVERELLTLLEQIEDIFCGFVAACIFINCDLATYVYLTDYEPIPTTLRRKVYYVPLGSHQCMTTFISLEQLELRYGGLATNADRYNMFYSSVNMPGSQTIAFKPIPHLGPTFSSAWVPPYNTALSPPTAADTDQSQKLLDQSLTALKAESIIHRICLRRQLFQDATIVNNNHSALLPFEIKMLTRMRRELQIQQGISLDASAIKSVFGSRASVDAVLLRCLHSAIGDLTHATHMFMMQLNRQTSILHDPKKLAASEEAFCRATSARCMYQHGFTYSKQPIIILRPKRMLGALLTIEDIECGITYLLDTICTKLLISGVVEQWVILVDLENDNATASPEVFTMFRAALNQITIYFPERTARLFIVNNSTAKPLLKHNFSWIGDYVPKSLQTTIYCVTSDVQKTVADILMNWIPKSQLEFHYGGSAPTVLDCSQLHCSEKDLEFQKRPTCLIPPTYHLIPAPCRGTSLDLLLNIHKACIHSTVATHQSPRDVDNNNNSPTTLKEEDGFAPSSSSLNSSKSPALLADLSEDKQESEKPVIASEVVQNSSTVQDNNFSHRHKETQSFHTTSTTVTLSAFISQNFSKNITSEPLQNTSEKNVLTPGNNETTSHIIKPQKEAKQYIDNAATESTIATFSSIKISNLPQGYRMARKKTSFDETAVRTTTPNSSCYYFSSLCKEQRQDDSGVHSNELSSELESVVTHTLTHTTTDYVARRRSSIESNFKLATSSYLPSSNEEDFENVHNDSPSLEAIGAVDTADHHASDKLECDGNTFRRRLLFEGPDIELTHFEKEHLQGLQDMLSKSSLADDATQSLTLPFLMRFLQTNEWDVRNSYTAILNHFQWRTTALCKNESDLGEIRAPRLCYVFGRDKRFRPILVSRLKYITVAADHPSAFRYVVYMINKTINELLIPGKVEQLTAIVDVDSVSVLSLPSFTAKTFVRELQDNFPERLHKIFVVNVTTAFRIFWNMFVSPFLHSSVRAKVFLLNQEFLQILRHDISRSHLEASLGGRRPDARHVLGQMPQPILVMPSSSKAGSFMAPEMS